MNNMCWTPAQQKCGVTAQSNVSATATMSSCSCMPSCKEISYKATISQNSFPSKGLALARCGQNENCVKMFSESALEFKVYYEQLNYQIYQEQEAYGLINLFSDIGTVCQIRTAENYSLISLFEEVLLDCGLGRQCAPWANF